VFADLRPYICTFPGCTDDLVQFTKRSLWADHEFKEHRTKKTWVCQECQVEFSNPQFWEQHIQRLHGASYPGSKRRIAISTVYRQREISAEHEKCFLCDTIPGKSRRAFVKHVGQHMEEIALVALPRQIEDDSGESTTTNEEGKDSLASLGSRSSKSPVATPGDQISYLLYMTKRLNREDMLVCSRKTRGQKHPAIIRFTTTIHEVCVMMPSIHR